MQAANSWLVLGYLWQYEFRRVLHTVSASAETVQNVMLSSETPSVTQKLVNK
jgi:hypothetical protein